MQDLENVQDDIEHGVQDGACFLRDLCWPLPRIGLGEHADIRECSYILHRDRLNAKFTIRNPTHPGDGQLIS
eukprot:1787197-Amphidinium_carterae.1